MFQFPPQYEHYVYPLTTFTERCILFLAKFSVLRTILLKLFTFEIAPKTSVFAQTIGMENSRNPSAERKTCLYPMVIDEKMTSLIARSCKQQQVSMHGALKTATAFAMSEIILQAAAEKGLAAGELNDGCITSAAVLDRHRTDFSYVTSQLFNIPHTINVNKYAPAVAAANDEQAADFWTLAKDMMRDLNASRDQGKRNWLVMHYLNIGHARRYYRGNRRQAYLMSISNVGNCNYLNRDAAAAGLKITAQFSGTGEHNADPVINTTVTSFNNKIYWAAVYFPNVTSKEFAVRLLQRSIAVLLDNCRKTVVETTD